ncbi:hypothetical protein GCM10025783_24240 [Amnibacterium soli]|uniref:Uncharacterized protein n=1 Tax=Amnibacterium soli TaxID=1282736 RepID=A0ABP8ZB71_9MICO
MEAEGPVMDLHTTTEREPHRPDAVAAAARIGVVDLAAAAGGDRLPLRTAEQP